MVTENKAEIERTVDIIFPASFKIQNRGCTELVFQRVHSRVYDEVKTMFEQGNDRINIIFLEKQRIQAIFHSEKLSVEQEMLLTPKFVTKPRKTTVSGKQSTFGDRHNNDYFKHLAEYKKDKDIYSRVQGLEMRGKKYRVSSTGSCPKCSSVNNVFVVLDFLFLSGDMPELLEYLLKKGKAMLWSDKGNMNCKDPPTFLCKGKCPNDVSKSGFNIDWSKTDLEKIYLFPKENFKEKDRYKADINILKSTPIVNKVETKKKSKPDLYLDDSEFLGLLPEDPGQEYSDDEYDEGHVDIDYYRNKVTWVVLDELVEDAQQMADDEEVMIRTMMALEEARTDYIYGEMKVKVHHESYVEEYLQKKEAEQPVVQIAEVVKPNMNDIFNKCIPARLASASSVAKDILCRDNKVVLPVTQATPTHIFKGATLYGKEQAKEKPVFTAADFPVSNDGKCPYCRSTDVVYIILQEGDNSDMPPLFVRLLKESHAKIMKKGKFDLPSFQCKSCTYGFNLNWMTTNLEKIFIESRTTDTQPVAPLYYYQNYPNFAANPWMGYPIQPVVIQPTCNPFVTQQPFFGWNQSNHPPPPPPMLNNPIDQNYRNPANFSHVIYPVNNQHVVAYENISLIVFQVMQDIVNSVCTDLEKTEHFERRNENSTILDGCLSEASNDSCVMEDVYPIEDNISDRNDEIWEKPMKQKSCVQDQSPPNKFMKDEFLTDLNSLLSDDPETLNLSTKEPLDIVITPLLENSLDAKDLQQAACNSPFTDSLANILTTETVSDEIHN